jgi:hypothetical protein
VLMTVLVTVLVERSGYGRFDSRQWGFLRYLWNCVSATTEPSRNHEPLFKERNRCYSTRKSRPSRWQMATNPIRS